ncbi:MAG: hypothetical protein KGL39_08910 [Patescibacteria group bacterium]|nr:hypothetical protein [Patescibacteria group bacterium]
MPAVVPLVAAAASAYAAKSAAGANASAAQNVAGMELGATSPYDMSTGFGSTYFGNTANGNSVDAKLNPMYGGLEQGLLGSSGGFLGSLDAAGASNGLTPFLQNAYSQYQNSLPNASGFGFGALANQAFGGNVGTAQNFGQAANALLGNLSSFNPATAGANYTNLLAQQSAPQNALATQNLAQQLFNSGALGSTGGANALTALGNMQGNQYVGQQIAGQQLGMQQQGLLGSLANNFGYTGNMMNSTNFGLGANLNNLLYGRQYGQAQQGFQNAIGLNQAGNQNMGTYMGLTQGLLGSGMGIDNALLNQMQTSAQMGAMRTGAAGNAGGQMLAGTLASNNMNAMTQMGLINGLSNVNWGGLFSSPLSPADANAWGSGMMANTALAQAGFTGNG